MSELGEIVARALSATEAAAAGFVKVCWRDGCSAAVEPTDDLGLCEPCKAALRTTTTDPSGTIGPCRETRRV